MNRRLGLVLTPIGCGGAIALANAGTLPDAAPWLVGGVALVAAVGLAPRASGTSTEQLERHLMRCRRRQEAAAVLVARVSAHAGSPQERPTSHERLTTCFRLTDSVVIGRTQRGCEIAAIFDEDRFDREGLERRLRAQAGAAALHCGWSRFPEEGLTLEALLDRARADLPAEEPAFGRGRAAAARVRAVRATGAEGK
jgi:hypothetical protein